MKTTHALIALSMLFSFSCAQKSALKGGTNTTSVAKEPEPEPAEPEKAEDQLPVTPEPEPVVPDPPGEPVKAVGINFEDNAKSTGGKGNDYNDAVLCFEGKFKVVKETRQIVAAEDQDIIPSTFAAGQCTHHLEISILSEGSDPRKELIVPNRKFGSAGMPKLSFKKGDALEVKLIPDLPTCADGVERKHTEKEYSEVDYDKCNNSGT